MNDLPLLPLGIDLGGLYDLPCGERGAWNSVGVEGLIERASSIRPYVKTSAANLIIMILENEFEGDRGVPQNRVAVNAGMFKIDTGGTIRTHNNL
jgi:hypothetical protein